MLALGTLGVSAQNPGGYVITNIGNYDYVKLVKALEKCRFDNYRKQNERVVLTFDEGTTVELLSVAEMQQQGYACDVTIVTPSAHAQHNIYILHPDGYILEQVRKDPTSNDRKREMVEDAKKQKP